MTRRPEWQLRSLRRIQWRVAWMFILAFIVSIAISWLLRTIEKKPIPVGLVVLIPVLVLFSGVSMAYFRGIDDGQAHHNSDDQKNTSNQALESTASRSD